MNIFDLQASISLNMAAFTSGVQEAQEAFSGLESSVSAKSIAIGNILADMATKAAGALTDFAKDAVDTGMGFDASMSNVKAISGATAEEFDELRAKAKEMGATTKFTATEAADAFSYMAMAGWKTEDMLDGIEGIMNLAAASGENLASTSDIVTDALTAFGLTAADSGRFADVLAAASSNANTNVGMMGETFKYVAPVAGALGYTIDDMATAIGTMANSGIKGSQAGTALRAALSRMVKPTEQAFTALGALNLTMEDEAGIEYNRAIQDAEGNMLPFSETVNVLREAFSGLSEAETAEYAAMLFGQEAMSGMLALINSAPEDYNALADAIANASEAAEGQGAAFEMAQTQLDNLSGRVTLFESAFDGLKVAIYESFSEPLSQAVETATGAISAMTEGFSEGGLQGAFQSLGEFANETFSGIVDSIGGASDAVGEFFDAFQGAGAEIISSATGYIDEFMGLFRESEVPGIISQLAGYAQDLFDAFKSASESVITGISNAVEGFFDVFDSGLAVSTLESIAEVLRKVLEPFTSAVSQAVSGVASGFEKLAGPFGEFVGSMSNQFLSAVRDLADDFDKWAPVVAAIAGGFVTMQIVTTVAAGFSALKAAMEAGQIATELMAIAQGALNAVMNANPVMLIVTAIGALVTGLVTAYATNEDFRNSVDALWAAIKDGAKVAFEALKTFFTETLPQVFNDMLAWFKSLPDKFVEIGRNIVDGIKNGFTAAWESFKETVSNLTSSIVDGVKNFFGIHSPSRVFAGIGENLVLGMEKGWGDEFGDLERLVGSDLSSLTGTARIGFESSAVGRSSAAQINTMLMAGQGSGSGPISINLILDGDVAATALYDPLRRVAWQKDHSEAVYA